MYTGLHVKYPLFCKIIIKLQFSLQVFLKQVSIKFHENLYSGNWVVPCGHTNMSKLTADFRYFANGPSNNDLHMNPNTTGGTFKNFVLYP
jgi:hypothetical protein